MATLHLVQGVKCRRIVQTDHPLTWTKTWIKSSIKALQFSQTCNPLKFKNMDPSTETTLLENQLAFPKKNTQKPYILTLIFILTLFIAGVITIITVITIHSYQHAAPTPSKSIQAICSFAPYKHLCISTLSSSISANTSGDKFIHFFPTNIIFHSFKLTVYNLIHLANISNPDNIPELKECQTLLNKEVSGLDHSVASSKNLYFFTGLEVDQYVEVFDRLKTYQQACLDRLAESGSSVIDEIRLNVQITRKFMLNTRAILLNRDTILDNIYGRSQSSAVDYYYDYLNEYYRKYFDWLGCEFMIIYVPQYVFLIVLLILVLKLNQ